MAEKSSVILRGFSELVVIVLGVLIALAADRWIEGIDARAEESLYIDRLISNLRADSTALEDAASLARARTESALVTLLYVETGQLPPDVDSMALVRSFITEGFYTPLDFSSDTWDDLVSSGRVRLISDPVVRPGLSEYYNDVEALGAVEAEWDGLMRNYVTTTQHVFSPFKRMVLRGAPGIPEDVARPYAPSGKDLAHLRAELAADETLQGAIGTARSVYWEAARQYQGLLDGQVVPLLSDLRGHAR